MPSDLGIVESQQGDSEVTKMEVAPVTAHFDERGITLIDPWRAAEGPEAVFERIYDRPL